jgi:hypothetical protein
MKPQFQIIFKFLILAIISGLVCYYFYTLNDKGEMFNKKSQTYDIINLGNSHGSCFDYKTYGIKGFNAYVNGSSPYYYRQLYTYYKEDLRQDAIVVIPLSYFIFGRDAGANNSIFNDQFYHFLPPSLIRDYDFKKHLDLINKNITTNVLDVLEAENNEGLELDTTIRFRPYSYAKFSQNISKENKDKSAEGKKIALKQQRIFDVKSVDANISYLSELIDDAIKSGLKPVLVTPPYLSDYSKNFSDAWLNENFYKHVTQLEEAYNIPYLDFSKSEDYRNHEWLFRDTHHVNNYGKVRFTKTFLNELIDLSYLKENVLPIEIKGLRNKVIDKDLRLEKVELFTNKGSEQSVLLFFFNKSLKQHFNNRNATFKFLNGEAEIYRDLNKAENFLFLKFIKLNKNTTFLFEEDRLPILEDDFDINLNQINLENQLNQTEKLLTKPFQFNNTIQVEEIVYSNDNANRFTFMFKMNNSSDNDGLENFTGYIKFYNGEITDQNKKVTTFHPKLLEIDGYKYIFATVSIDNVELSKLDIFFIKNKPKEVSNIYIMKDLKLIKH